VASNSRRGLVISYCFFGAVDNQNMLLHGGGAVRLTMYEECALFQCEQHHLASHPANGLEPATGSNGYNRDRFLGAEEVLDFWYGILLFYYSTHPKNENVTRSRTLGGNFVMSKYDRTFSTEKTTEILRRAKMHKPKPLPNFTQQLGNLLQSSRRRPAITRLEARSKPTSHHIHIIPHGSIRSAGTREYR